MTDRFDAQLRQHLLETANERPADGQIATVLEHVDATVQRNPLAARLAWWPGRIGPFPSAAIRYGLVAAALVAAMVAALLFAAGGPGRPTAFEGTWTAVDLPDGSNLTLVVGPGTNPTVHFEDDFATGAACVDDAIKVFTAEGRGEIEGSRLVVTYADGGGCGSAVVPLGGTIFDYHADTDTILDDDGFVWSRVRGGAIATIPPGTEPAPTPRTVFEGTWTATDVPDGSTLTLVVGPGSRPTVHFEDDYAMGAVCQLDNVKVFTADGTGVISDGRLDASFPDGGGCGTAVTDIGLQYTYRPGFDTLVDHDGVIWSRVDGDLPSGSEPPRTDAPESIPQPTSALATGDPRLFPAFAPLPSYTCDLLEGSYGGHFGTTLVTVATPTTWHGLDDVFHAEDEGCGGGAGARIEVTVASEVYPDTCEWLGTGVAAGSRAAETAAFSEQTLFEVTGPVETELGGYPARRYDFALPVDLDTSTCSSTTLQLWRDPARDKHFGPTISDSGSMTVYFVEVDEVTFGVYAFKGEGNSTPAIYAELDAVVESLRFEP